jgi:hypothetical protein
MISNSIPASGQTKRKSWINKANEENKSLNDQNSKNDNLKINNGQI